jgi:hypothetical protein
MISHNNQHVLMKLTHECLAPVAAWQLSGRLAGDAGYTAVPAIKVNARKIDDGEIKRTPEQCADSNDRFDVLALRPGSFNLAPRIARGESGGRPDVAWVA